MARTEHEWATVGWELFDAGKPALLVDAEFRCTKVSASFDAALGEAPAHLWDAVPSAAAALFRAAASSKQRATLSFLWRESVAVAADVYPVGDGLLVVLHPNPLLPADEVLRYELQERDGLRTVVHALTSSGAQPVTDGAPCWMQLGRASECVTCPVRELGDTDRATVLNVPLAGAFSVVISVARRHGASVTVTNVPLENATWSALVAARITHLANQCKVSARERQLLELLLLGRNLAEVSTVLGITERTAKFHQQNLLRKLGADSRHDLFRIVL